MVPKNNLTQHTKKSHGRPEAADGGDGGAEGAQLPAFASEADGAVHHDVLTQLRVDQRQRAGGDEGARADDEEPRAASHLGSGKG